MMAMSSGVLAPSLVRTESDFSARCTLADLSLVQPLLLFLQDCVVEFQSAPPHYNPPHMWVLLRQLTSGAALVIQLLALDAIGSACQGGSKLHSDMLQDALTHVQHGLFMKYILASQHVGVMQATEAFTVAPQVMWLVT